MLLANMAKHDSIQRLVTIKPSPPASAAANAGGKPHQNPTGLDQLLDIFNQGADNKYNASANFNYLAYLFADIAKFPSCASHLLTSQPYDGIRPLEKLLPFISHASVIRRRGCSAATKNIAFSQISSHADLLGPSFDILPMILRPLASGADSYKASEEEELPEDLQFLDDSVQREADNLVLCTHLDTLLLLTSARENRDVLRNKGVYYVVRECHLAVENDDVRDACDRLVQVLMRDEEGEERPLPVAERGYAASGPGQMLVADTSAESPKETRKNEDEDDKVVEIAL